MGAEQNSNGSVGTARFPRVLFVTPHACNWRNAGAFFSTLFSGWPKDRLATITNDHLPVEHDVCARYFFLTGAELPRQQPFEWVAARRAPEAAAAGGGGATPSGGTGRLKAWLFGPDKVPETPRISPALVAFINAFEPDVIYTPLGTAGFMELVELICERWSLPLVTHVMDDWRPTVHRSGLLAPVQRRRLLRTMRRLFERAGARLVIGPTMEAVFERDYGLDFDVLHASSDTRAVRSLARVESSARRPARILYSGSVYEAIQLPMLRTVAELLPRLNATGCDVRLRVATLEGQVAMVSKALEGCTDVEVVVGPADRGGYLRSLVEADLLLLPVAFTEYARSFVRHSLPAKLADYLPSGTPIVAVGPPDIAQARDATANGWALVIGTPDPTTLSEGLRQALSDGSLRDRLREAAWRTAEDRFEQSIIRPRFEAILAQAAAGGRR